MSHDQKPGRVRIVQDQPPGAATAALPATLPTDAPAPDTDVAPARRGLPLVAPLLFLAACAAGGLAQHFLMP